jgi:rSAM/selenodomain-associated transferase 2
VTGGLVGRILVVDGGSTDDSCALARSGGAEILTCAPGRGRQLRHGASASRADWLFFLHADTRPDPSWVEEVGALCRTTPADDSRAAVFRLRFDDRARAARFISRMVLLRTRLLGLPYGDQGLVIARRLYDGMGGFKDLRLMEDVDMARRLGRRRIRLLSSHVTTSAERYRRSGYLRQSLANLSLLLLYFAGLSPERLARLYR